MDAFDIIFPIIFLTPFVIIAIVIISVIVNLSRFTKNNLGMNLKGTKVFISEGIKNEVMLPKPITSLSAVYAPKIQRDFPQVGYNGMDTMARNALVSALNAIESKSVSGLSKAVCAPAFITKVQNTIDDLCSRDASERYDNIKIHKSGIASYINKGNEAIATFEISVQYNYSITRGGKTSMGASDGLTQAAYRMLLTYNQQAHESTTEMVYSSNCPNCGAPINVGANEKVCPYCGSGYTEIADRVWQVTDFSLLN